MLAKLFSSPLFCADICVVSVLLLFVSELFVQATNINAVAVSVLKEVSCIIIADGFEPDNAALKKAEEEGLTIFASKKSVYDLAKQLGELGI